MVTVAMPDKLSLRAMLLHVTQLKTMNDLTAFSDISKQFAQKSADISCKSDPNVAENTIVPYSFHFIPFINGCTNMSPEFAFGTAAHKLCLT